MSSNLDLEEGHQDVSMPTILAFDAGEGDANLNAERKAVLNPSASKTLVTPLSNPESAVSKLEAALTAPRTIMIQKPTTPASKSLSTTASTAPPVSGKASAPRRQLQFLCENGRVVAAPLAVGLPSTASAVSKEPTEQSAAAAVLAASEEQLEPAVEPVATALPTAPATSVIEEGHVDISTVASQSAEMVSETLPPECQPGQAEWVVEMEDSSQSTDAVGSGEQQPGAVNTMAGMKVHNVDAVNALDVVEAVEAVNRIEARRKSRLVLNSAGALVESSTATAVLDAVESAASVSHVVFESDGRAVGALMPAPGEDGQQGQQQVVLTGQQGDQQVVLAVDGDVLGTAAGGDGKNIILQVDEASDSVTLLVNRPAKGPIYELASEGGELLELWERDSDGKDRHLETVTEISLVDIRAVCEQCGCAISHHMVGLLARRDGTEYGYRCRLCQCVQTDVDVMARHMDSHRPLADTQCRFCSRGLRTFKPQAARTYTCHACQLVFVSRHEMIKHREIHPPKRRFPCELCDKAFQMKVQLEVHMRTHLGHKPYACDMCPATFTQPSHLINHRRTHTGERPYSCERCGRSFVQQGHLRAHERTHTGERPYKCDICGRGFRQSGQLTAHKKLHEGDAPFKLRRRHGEPIAVDEITCPECKKTFRLPKDLKRHMLIHTEGAFKCETCDRSFKRADHLRRHLRRHENPRPRQRGRPRLLPTEAEEEQQGQDLSMLDHVIDSVLDNPEEHVGTEGALKMQEEHGDLRVEVDEEDDDDAYSDDSIGHQEGDENPDNDAEEDGRVHRPRISRAPEDALWSQADRSDDVRWQRVKQRGGRRPVGKDAYGRRSRLLDTPLTDDGVDDEMAMLTAALRERTTAEKPKRGRGAGRGPRQNPPEPTVKLEPVDWDDWQPGEGGGQHGENVDHREDDNWTGASREGVGGKRRSFHLDGARRAEDLVLPVWDDVDMTENTPGSHSTMRSEGFGVTDQALRTSRRSTAGNWAANVGVSLSRTSHRGGKR